MKNLRLHALLDRMRETHDKKNADYTSGSDPYENFSATAQIAGVDEETVFLTMIGVKLARILALKRSGKVPNHESLQDSRLDLAVYAALYASYFEPVEVKE